VKVNDASVCDVRPIQEAWEDLCLHSLETCAACRSYSRAVQDDAPACLEERELYRVWKKLWDAAGRPTGIATEVLA